MKKIYVGHIPFNAKEEDLRNLFAEFGEIESIRIVKDRVTGQSRGFGFVEMATETDAQRALSALKGKSFMGETLTVAEARPQQTRHGFGDRRSTIRTQRKERR
jgi:RNA recognition motif-containing protein